MELLSSSLMLMLMSLLSFWLKLHPLLLCARLLAECMQLRRTHFARAGTFRTDSLAGDSCSRPTQKRLVLNATLTLPAERIQANQWTQSSSCCPARALLRSQQRARIAVAAPLRKISTKTRNVAPRLQNVIEILSIHIITTTDILFNQGSTEKFLPLGQFESHQSSDEQRSGRSSTRFVDELLPRPVSPIIIRSTTNLYTSTFIVIITGCSIYHNCLCMRARQRGCAFEKLRLTRPESNTSAQLRRRTILVQSIFSHNNNHHHLQTQ